MENVVFEEAKNDGARKMRSRSRGIAGIFWCDLSGSPEQGGNWGVEGCAVPGWLYQGALAERARTGTEYRGVVLKEHCGRAKHCCVSQVQGIGVCIAGCDRHYRTQHDKTTLPQPRKSDPTRKCCKLKEVEKKKEKVPRMQ